MKKVLVICGGPSSEYEVSLDTARSISKYIDGSKYDVSICHIDKKRKAIISNEDIEKVLKKDTKKDFIEILEDLKPFDVCLLATHGEFGEDGTLQTLLEYANIPYTGCDSYSSRLCMDKYRSMSIIENLVDGVVLPKTVLAKREDLSDIKIPYPLVYKPNRKGSSVGVYIVQNDKDKENALKNIEKDVEEQYYLVQEAILNSLEVSCGCLQKKDGSFIDIPPIEIIPQINSFFDYDSKYTKGGSMEITPPKSIDKKMSDKIIRLAQEIHKELGCRLYSRSDFLVKDGKVYFLELNTLPGMTSTSLIPQECNAIGMSYTDLVTFLIENT